jgi:hypothetical protein
MKLKIFLALSCIVIFFVSVFSQIGPNLETSVSSMR